MVLDEYSFMNLDYQHAFYYKGVKYLSIEHAVYVESLGSPAQKVYAYHAYKVNRSEVVEVLGSDILKYWNTVVIVTIAKFMNPVLRYRLLTTGGKPNSNKALPHKYISLLLEIKALLEDESRE